jgi:hypothetical protein
MVVQTWMRFFNKIVKSTDTITTYNKDDVEVTTQPYTVDEDSETVNEAESAQES